MDKDQSEFSKFITDKTDNISQYWDNFIEEQAQLLCQSTDMQIMTESLLDCFRKRKSKSDWRGKIEIL